MSTLGQLSRKSSVVCMAVYLAEYRVTQYTAHPPILHVMPHGQRFLDVERHPVWARRPKVNTARTLGVGRYQPPTSYISINGTDCRDRYFQGAGPVIVTVLVQASKPKLLWRQRDLPKLIITSKPRETPGGSSKAIHQPVKVVGRRPLRVLNFPLLRYEILLG